MKQAERDAPTRTERMCPLLLVVRVESSPHTLDGLLACCRVTPLSPHEPSLDRARACAGASFRLGARSRELLAGRALLLGDLGLDGREVMRVGLLGRLAGGRGCTREAGAARDGG